MPVSISGSEDAQHLGAGRVDALAAVLRGEPQLALAVEVPGEG